MDNKKIEKTIKYLEKGARTEKEIKDFLSGLELSEVGVIENFTALFKYDLLTYNEAQGIELNYTLLYFPKKSIFAINQKTNEVIRQVQKMQGTYKECEKKRAELVTRLNVSLDRFVIV